MDILVPERGSRQRSGDAHPAEARIWGLAAVAAVLGLLILIVAFERSDRQQLASGEPVIVQRVPAALVPDPALP